jgi:mannose-6-phosphate isomerase-like protein (cupin superfamily)
MLQKVSLAEAFTRFEDTWSPKIVGDVNDSQVKVAKFDGEFTWHHHEHEDELFLVVAGSLRIDLEDGAVELKPGELVIIPRASNTVPSRSLPRRSCSSSLQRP